MVRLGYDGEMSIITDGVFIGRFRAARDLGFLKQHGITHVINCAALSCESLFPHALTYLNLPLKDEPASEEQPHLPLTPLARFIPSAAFFMQDALDSGGRVMVHCRKGVSRSVSIVAGFLMYERGAALAEALTLIRRRRRVADPNVWFVEDLKAYEARLEADRLNRFRSTPPPALALARLTQAPSSPPPAAIGAPAAVVASGGVVVAGADSTENPAEENDDARAAAGVMAPQAYGASAPVAPQHR